MAEIQAALDVAVSASTSEAFSNSIGEALACGVPVVTTDVGDSARLVGDAGRVVPVDDTVGMAASCVEILRLTDEERRHLSRRARERMERHYEIGVIANRYAELWQSVAAVPRRRAA
jgi:glycosyltransferase involved in cell wall biosynthesis